MGTKIRQLSSILLPHAVPSKNINKNGRNIVRHLLNVCGIATAAIALAAVMPSAIAQESTFTYTCQTVGTAPPEPLGDREGHAISVSEVSCSRGI